MRLATTDPVRASELLRQPFPGIELSTPAGSTGFTFAYEQVSDGRMTVKRLRLTGTGVGEGSVGDGIGVARVRGGRFHLEYGRNAVDTSLPFLRPVGQSRAHMRDAHLQLIDLEPRAFAAAAHPRLEGSGRTVRPPSIAETGPSAQGLIPFWHSTVDLVMSVAFDEDAFAAPLVRAGLFDLVLTGLLAAFPLTAEIGVASQHGAGPAAVRRALAFIDENLSEPIDVAAVAAAAGLPVRTLQSVFRSQIGVTPMEQLRLRRLAAARADLIEADPTSGASVTGIAHRWGFAHAARFAGQYRRAYGELPSDTLRL